MENAHMQALGIKHARLEEQISAESHRPLPDQTLLVRLKKQKLKLKEELRLA